MRSPFARLAPNGPTGRPGETTGTGRLDLIRCFLVKVALVILHAPATSPVRRAGSREPEEDLADSDRGEDARRPEARRYGQEP